MVTELLKGEQLIKGITVTEAVASPMRTHGEVYRLSSVTRQAESTSLKTHNSAETEMMAHFQNVESLTMSKISDRKQLEHQGKHHSPTHTSFKDWVLVYNLGYS